MEKDLIKLLKDIKYKTGYMTGSWEDHKMLKRMSIEDGISPWSIEGEVDSFVEKHKLNLKEDA
jgi:hypothetical protein